MNQRNSSTSNSDQTAATTLRGVLATAGWFVVCIGVFELAVLGLARLGDATQPLHTYFDYGTSVESKLRVIAGEAHLAERHVFNAGWLDDIALPPSNEHYDLAVYGMSFAHDLVLMLEQLRPSLKVRALYGPGAPLSHSYASYREDAPKRRAQAVMIPVLSDGIPYLTSMTHDTVEPDHVQPMTWPRYEVQDGEPVLVAMPVLRSADALRRALSSDPALWQQHLDMLAAHDRYFSRFSYAADWTEHVAALRLVRRAFAHARTHDIRAHIKTQAGFVPDSEAAELARALLRRYIRDVLEAGELPVVVLFDAPGEPAWLQDLFGAVLAEARVPVIRSQDHCDAGHRENFNADGHYVAECVRAIGTQFIQVLDHSQDGRLAAERRRTP